MIEYAFFVALIGGLSIIQTTVSGWLFPAELKPDLLIAPVIWAALGFDEMKAVGFAFLSGLTLDALSGSPPGMFAVLYALVCVSCRRLDTAFRIDDLVGKCIMVTASAAATGAVALLFRLTADASSLFGLAALWIGGKAALTGISAIIIIPMVDRAHSFVVKGSAVQ